MLEKFMQAALITFLLHLIAGLSTPTQISTKVVSSQTSSPVISSNASVSK